ncbi:MAG TPA: transglutaminaseTgpA domain-containing protein [Opitutaceae bacterium]|jgi:hypothetical protein|nr:transglutaminaseTgpA domain-containing protein [Opitutaceae bacterium]
MSMEKKRPQLSLDELHQLKWLLGGALALLSSWSVLYLDVDAWSLMLAATVLVPVMLARPDWAARWPAWAHWLAFPAIVFFFAGDLYTKGEVLPALIRLDLLLLLYRGTSLRQRRDDLQLILLGLFLIIVAGVLTVSLVFAAQILAFTACALVLLLVITLVDAKGTGVVAASAVPAWTRVRWWRLFGRLRAVTDWRVVALGGGLFAGVVGLSALLFIVMPRFELANSLFLDRLITRRMHTGFSDTIHFGDVTDIQQDNSVALRVEAAGRGQLPANPYWRMVVLDEYRDGEFRVSNALRGVGLNYTNESFARGGEGGGADVWTLYLEPGVSRYLPLTGGFGLLRLGAPADFRFNHATRVVALRNDPAMMVAYRVTGMQASNALPAPAREERTGMLKLAVSDRDRMALKKFADEIAGGAQLGTAEFGRRATAWLAQRHGYSLQMQLPPGVGDPLVRWMDSRAPGHCELFAGALALLARAEGHPARVVAGFEGGDWNAFENYLMVRNSDAHAWCEVYDEAAGAWLRVDPTPGAAADAGAANPAMATVGVFTMDRSWSARFDSLRMLWYRHIVNFDQRSQRETLQAVKSTTQEIGQWLRIMAGRMAAMVRGWLRTPWDMRRLTEIFAMAAAAVALVIAGWRARWRLRRRPGRKGRIDPVRREAGRWLARLRGREESPEFPAGLERLRYGARETWPEPEAVFRQARRLARRRIS